MIAHAMVNEIYNKEILRLAASIPHLGRLEKPDASATAHSRLCGSRVSVDLAMQGDTVTGFAQDVKACALGQTAASIAGRHIIGSTASEIRQVAAQMRAMLKDNASPPDGKWKDLAILEPVREYKARHTSTMLVFDAVEDAISRIEAARAKAAS